MNKKRKVNIYIDGFNLYHALCNTGRIEFKWIDLKKLSLNYIDSETQELGDIYFFTAYPVWNNDKLKRHKLYVNALMSVGVKIELGKFIQTTKKFNKKNNLISKIFFDNAFFNFFKDKFSVEQATPEKIEYKTHEEKRTDVNIVLKIFEHAVKNRYDDAIIISGDSDIIPVIKSVKNTVKDKNFISVLPFKSKGREINKACDSFKVMTWKHLENSILPKTINYGKIVINSPYIN